MLDFVPGAVAPTTLFDLYPNYKSTSTPPRFLCPNAAGFL